MRAQKRPPFAILLGSETAAKRTRSKDPFRQVKPGIPKRKSRWDIEADAKKLGITPEHLAQIIIGVRTDKKLYTRWYKMNYGRNPRSNPTKI